MDFQTNLADLAPATLLVLRKTGDLLERLTWGFAIAIMVLSLSTNFVTQNKAGSTNEILDRASEQAPASLPMNNTPAQQPTATDSTK